MTRIKVRLPIVLFVLSCLPNVLLAQNKVFTIAEAVRGGYTTFAPKGIDQFQWIPQKNAFSQMVKQGDERYLLVQEIENTRLGLKKEIRLANLNKALANLSDTIKQLTAFPAITWLDNSRLKFYQAGLIIGYHTGDERAEILCPYNPTEMEEAVFNADNSMVAYVKNDNVFIASNKEEQTVTVDGGNGIVNGRTVHRSEFGINNGLFWSNNGKKLAYYRMDESMVTTYPLYQLHERPATAKMIRYPIAGAKSHHVHVAVYNPATGGTIYLKTGEPLDQYLTNVTWSPDDKTIYLAIVNRAQNHMWLRAYDATTGNLIKTLFDEHDERYVEPEHGPVFLKNDPTKFVWYSERDGYNHLYLYNTDGTLIKQLTAGKWVVTDFFGFDQSGEKLYIAATEVSPLERHLYCVNAKSGKLKKLSSDKGMHNFKPSFNQSIFYDDYSNSTTPRKTLLISEDGNLLETLAAAESTVKDYAMAAIETGKIKAADGTTDLFYRLYKPINFDATRKYPVVVYLYNGPHLQLVTDNWMGGLNFWYHYMAQHGFAVFIIDGRGSLNRGFNFESSVHRNLGTNEMKDQLKGVEWLKSQSWVDAGRLGIHGWSFGGFMTTTLMSRAPGTFKVGVAGGPVIDWGLYEIMYTERYMDTPEENPEGYKTSNLLNYTDSLQGKLLMIHGAQDNVVLWQHSLLYIEECIKKGKQIDYFVYPQHEHNVLGKDRIHLMEKVSNYFFDNL